MAEPARQREAADCDAAKPEFDRCREHDGRCRPLAPVHQDLTHEVLPHDVLTANRGSRWYWATAIVGLVLCFQHFAQSGAALAQPVDRGARPFQEAVSIPVDNDAAKRLLTIDDRWAAGRWQEALDDLIALCESSGSSIVQIDRGDVSGIRRYQRVDAACELFLEKLPPEGLQRYRQRIDTLANPLWRKWEETGQPHYLEQLVTRASYSSRGADALLELGQIAFAAGQLERARHYWGQLLPAAFDFPGAPGRRIPGATLPVADIAARLVLCDIHAGLERATESRRAFETQFPEAVGRLGGNEGRWVDLLTTASRAAAAPELPSDPDVPTFAGANSRTSRSLRSLDLGSELWSVPLSIARVPRSRSLTILPHPNPLACYPAVVNDVTYLNDGQRVWAWSLFSGRPAWDDNLSGTGQIYPPITVDDPLPPRRAVQGSPLWTVSVAHGRLYACLGSLVTTASPLELRDQSTELVCLDVARGQGRLLWKLTSADISSRLPREGDDPGWSWEGTPLVADAKLYAVLSRRRPQLEWSVVCLDAETGHLLWHRAVGISRPTPPDHENLASHLLLSAGPGRLYLATHWGAVLALSQADGALHWAVTYGSESREDGHPLSAPLSASPPCLVAGDRVYVAPSDSRQVLCLSSETGRTTWQQSLPDRIQHLIGISRGRLLVSGNRLWGLNHETGGVHWRVESAHESSRGYGRGWLAGRTVYWPSRESVCIVEAETGQLLREQPLLTPQQRRFGGHLVAHDGVLLVAGSDRLSAYGEYSQLRETQEGLISRLPHLARPVWRLAELAFAHEESARAIQLWTQLWLQHPAAQPDAAVPPVAAMTAQPAQQVWQERAAARLIATQLQSSAAGVGQRREQFARAARFAVTPTQRESLLQAELRLANDADWRIDVLTRWLRAPYRTTASTSTVWPVSSETPPARPTRWQIAAEFAALRQRHGDAPFAHYDAAAAQRWQQLRGTSADTAVRQLATEFPTAKVTALPDNITVSLSEVSTELPPATAAAGAGYWKPVWQRPRSPTSRVIVPQPGASSQLLLIDGDLSVLRSGDGQTQPLPSITQPPVAAFESGARLLLVTPTEWLAISAATSSLLWRRPAPQTTTAIAEQPAARESRITWQVDGEQLIRIDPTASILVVDAATGETRWECSQTAQPLRPPVAIIGDRIIGQSRRQNRVRQWSLTDGRVLANDWPEQRPWLRPIHCSDDGREWVTVDDQRQVSSWTADGVPLWSYSGLISQAHDDPLPIAARDGRWLLLIDGVRLAAVGSQGRPQSVTPLTSLPVAAETGALRVDAAQQRLLAVTENEVVGVELAQANHPWRRPLVAASDVHLTWPADSPIAAVWYRSRLPHDRWVVDLLDSATGRLRQRITLPESAGPLTHLAFTADQLTLVARHTIIGYQPHTSATQAASR